MKKHILFYFLIAIKWGSYGQTIKENVLFEIGEELHFKITYGIFNTSIASLKVNDTLINNISNYKVIAHGETTGLAKLFFNVNDDYFSVFSKNIKPIIFGRSVKEGDYYAEESIYFNENKALFVNNLDNTTEEINVSENIIKYIDVSNLNKLQTLYISHNKIRSIENLPPSLVEFVCDFNQLQQLNLLNNINLKLVNVSNNKITLIETLPENTKQIIDNNPSVEYRNTDISQIGGDDNDNNPNDTNYKDALNTFFSMKNEYETKIHNKKKTIYDREPNKKIAKKLIKQYIPECVKCKRKVGSIFSKEDNTYTIICGDTKNPCNLDVQIFAGTLTQFHLLFEVLKEGFDETRDIVIRQKLDTLFDYVSEEESVKLFKKQNELYTSNELLYKEQLEKYNEMYNNTDTARRIQEKQEKLFSLIEKNKELIDEYKNTNNREFLKAAIDLQINEISNEVHNIRILKHEIMEIITQDTSNTFPLNTLFQNPVSLSKLDYSSGEQQRVISFTV